VQLVVALARSGKIIEAAQEAQQLPVESLKNGDAAAAVLVAAEGAYKSNDFRTAEKLFAVAAREGVPDQQRTQALSGLAWTQYRSAGKQVSAATFERLLQEYPDSPLAAEAAAVRARSLEEAKQYDAALATYRLVVEEYPESPLAPSALWGAARLHDRLEQDREAAAMLARLINEHPQFAERDAALYQLGWVLTDLEDQHAGEAAHARLVKEYPQSAYFADAAYRLAEQAARRQETSRAIELADQVLAIETATTVRESALYLRGQLAAAGSKWDEVARFMRQHASEFPKSSMNLSARYWQAEAAFRQADYTSADKQLAELDAAAQSRREAWLGIVPLRRAQSLAQQNRWPDALRMAESVAKRYPQFKQLHEADYLIGRALGMQARFDEARVAYDRAIRSPLAEGSETAAMAQWMIGETYFHQKRYPEAIAAYERCLNEHAIGRWQAAALLQAGKCRLIMGETEKARADLERVVREFADQPLAAEAKSRLQALGLPRAAGLDSLEPSR
jgi:TolA-binding protein